jgi:hypothetical protein
LRAVHLFYPRNHLGPETILVIVLQRAIEVEQQAFDTERADHIRLNFEHATQLQMWRDQSEHAAWNSKISRMVKLRFRADTITLQGHSLLERCSIMQNRSVAIVKLVRLLSLALWGGGTVFFSFVAAPRIFGYLRDELPATPPPGLDGLTHEIGRRLAGETVGAIFPAYFASQIIVGSLAVGSGVMLGWLGDRLARFRSVLPALALALVVSHALTVYPRSVRVLDAHYRAQDRGDEREAIALRSQFGMWHGISQTLNLFVILFVFASLIVLDLGCREETGDASCRRRGHDESKETTHEERRG